METKNNRLMINGPRSMDITHNDVTKFLTQNMETIGVHCDKRIWCVKITEVLAPPQHLYLHSGNIVTTTFSHQCLISIASTSQVLVIIVEDIITIQVIVEVVILHQLHSFSTAVTSYVVLIKLCALCAGWGLRKAAHTCQHL